MKLILGKYHLELSPGHLVIYSETLGDLERALRHNQDVLLQNPNDFDAHFALGNILRMQGRILEARNEYLLVAQSNSPWAESAARIFADLEGKADFSQQIDRTLHHAWSTPLWRPVATWNRWIRKMKQRLNSAPFTPDANNIPRAIEWVLQREDGILAYNELVRKLQKLTEGTGIVWTQTQVNEALYGLWRDYTISSPGVRWLPERPERIDGIFDDPSWHTMLITLVNAHRADYE